jgi:ribosomal protein S18 acetylase RimI-like enzyme
MRDRIDLPPTDMKLDIHPLDPSRWPDLEAIFNAKGCSMARQCWCMYYRRSGGRGKLPQGMSIAEFNRSQLRAVVDAGRPPGLIGYLEGTPVGWVSLGPRQDYGRLAKSPVMKPVDDEPVWSIVCFVVPSAYRGQGVARALLDGAVAYARERGAKLVEAYPVDLSVRADAQSVWFGTKAMYDAAGFEEVARRTPERPIVRLDAGPAQRARKARGR